MGPRHDPAVYETVVTAADVLALTDSRDEHEFVSIPGKTRRLPLTTEQLQQGAERYRTGQTREQ